AAWGGRWFFWGPGRPGSVYVLWLFANCYWIFYPRKRHFGPLQAAALHCSTGPWNIAAKNNSRAARRPGLGQVGFSAVLSQREECGSDKWMKASPYLTIGATEWCISKGVVIVGYDFYHGNDEPRPPP